MEGALTGILAGNLTRIRATDTVRHDVECAVKLVVVRRLRFIYKNEVLVMTSYQTGIGPPGGR